MNFPYSIPIRRHLSEKERALVRHLLAETAPENLWKVEQLEVFARCGCGKCPTIIFHPETDGKEPAQLVADYMAGSPVAPVGIMLWERGGELSELEACPFGEEEVSDWPPIETLRPWPADSKR